MESPWVGFTYARSPLGSSADELLTKRQLEVARLAARGLTDRAIADRLGLSPHTVHTHLRNIFVRLQISSREELAERL
jgi:DNA-binding CsgD family transcriptional regulator